MKQSSRVIRVLAATGCIFIFAAVSAAQIIYDNGPFATGTLARNGTSMAPPGFQWSEASYDFGSTTATNTLAGVGCQLIGVATANRCADDFNVPVGQTWTISQVIVFSYQTGSVANPFIGANLRIWRGRPGDVGSIIVFGDTTTNRMGTSTDTTVYRIFNSGPPGNTATGTTRLIRQVPINVSPAAVLTAGNYWVDFQTDAGAGGNFSPGTTITGTRGVPGWNARQFIGPPTNTGWADSFDTGNPATSLDIVQEFPFKLAGSVMGAPVAPRSRVVDFNGDNKSDLVIARSAGSISPSTWWINDGTTVTATPFGLGVGFAGADIATPKDFDGDGKADISVWRGNPSNPDLSYFYTLQSSTSTVLSVQFGRNGDDPTIVEDYDGDGKADYAVFRSTPIPGFDPCGGSAAWYYKPSMTPATIFSYDCWGSAGDKVYPGDFDGDRKADFVVVRNSSGNADIYQKLSGGGTSGFRYGLFTDKFVSGDFDSDGRTDLCVVRGGTGGQYFWYLTKSGNGQFVSLIYGDQATDYLVPADYDGDGKTDFAVWRSGAGADNGYFYQFKTFTSPGGVKFGQSAAPLSAPDLPVASALVSH